MKRILISAVLALTLVVLMAAPVSATEDVESIGASVSVGEVVSITLIDAGAAGINFGNVTPPVTEQGDVAQSSGTPAIKVNVGTETNVSVDISIMGSTASSVPLGNWEYSTTFAGTKTGLQASYVEVYDNVGAGSANDFYHWITVDSGTASGSHTATVTYKAETHS